MKHSHVSTEILLTKAGSKKTSSRHEVLEILFHATKPLSIKEIFSKIQDKKTDQVTVYRIVKSFTEKDVLRQIDLGHDQAYFEIADDENDHHHIICMRCHTIADFTGCDANILIAKALKQVKTFTKVTRHSFELFGLCTKCSKKA